MKNLLLIIFIITANLCFSQTHTRKTRSDKGKTHKHSATYIAKKAIKPKSPTTKKKK
jgi:hypothetical protein